MLAADGARAWPAALPDVPQLKGRLTGQLETLVVTSRQKVYQCMSETRIDLRLEA